MVEPHKTHRGYPFRTEYFMTSFLPRATRSAALIAGFGLILMTAGCPKAAPEPTPVPVAAPEVTLQVSSVDPSKAQPNKAFAARVFGSGFEDGAKVWIGSTEMSQARVENANTIKMSVAGLAEGTFDIVVENPDGTRSTLRGGLRVKTRTTECDFVRVGFGFDSSKLDQGASASLDKALSCYQARSGTVTVEGHTDNRGTTEYNLALGNRRADTVARYIKNKGVAASRVKAVSYGEERPVNKANNEASWSENRRADLVAKD
jgi:peptidoglycan-associated lipoprotein